MTKGTRSQAQIDAEKRYGKKRKTGPQFPGGHITKEQSEQIDRLAAVYGTKKDGILAAIDGWLRVLDKAKEAEQQ